MSRSRRIALWLGASLVGLGCVVAGGYLVVELVFEFLPDRYAERGQSRSDVSSLAVQLLGGLLLVVGAVYTARTYRLTRSGQIAQRYATAIGQLGSNGREDRLGGIYALERIARDSQYDHVRVVEVLTAYLRDRDEWRSGSQVDDRETGGAEAVAAPQPGWDQWRPERPATYVQATIAVLGRRKTRHDEHKLDLRSTDLRDVRFGKGNFNDANLREANLEGAHLAGTKLNRAALSGAILRRANLEGSQLVAADLDGADLEAAKYDRRTKWPAGFDFVAATTLKHDEHDERSGMPTGKATPP
jgi:Pentapeptide repeats (8 copies)